MYINNKNQQTQQSDECAKWRDDPRPSNGICPCGRSVVPGDALILRTEMSDTVILESICPDCHTTWDLRSQELRKELM